MVFTASKHSVIATHTEGQAFLVSVRGHTISTDQPIHAGGGDTAPGPLELLSVALAGCIALYTHRYCAAHALARDDLAVEVRPLWRENRIARFDVVLHVPESIDAANHAALLEVARTCPVHNTLTHAPEITVQIS